MARSLDRFLDWGPLGFREPRGETPRGDHEGDDHGSPPPWPLIILSEPTPKLLHKLIEFARWLDNLLELHWHFSWQQLFCWTPGWSFEDTFVGDVFVSMFWFQSRRWLTCTWLVLVVFCWGRMLSWLSSSSAVVWSWSLLSSLSPPVAVVVVVVVVVVVLV